MLELRDYQSDAKAALYDYLRRKDGNPCVVIPTAGGKSICIASVAADAVNVWRGRVLILAHVKELVDQNSKELKGLCPDLPVGVYSAGLDRRDTKEPVIVAGIQSIYNKIDLFEPFDLRRTRTSAWSAGRPRRSGRRADSSAAPKTSSTRCATRRTSRT